MSLIFKNFATTTLGIATNTSTTSFTVTDASVFPTFNFTGDYFYALLIDTSGASATDLARANDPTKEIVKVTAKSGNVLTVVRGAEGTTAQNWPAGTQITWALTAQTLTDMNVIVNVKQFGAVGDGSTDDTTAIQRAHNSNKMVYYPAGTYAVSSTITISNGGIIGEGQGKTFIKTTNTGATAIFQYNGIDGTFPRFENFYLYAATSHSGPGIWISSNISWPTFDSIYFSLLGTAIQMDASVYFQVHGCTFNSCTTGIQIDNTVNSDAGDNVIEGCNFLPAVSGSGIIHKASGGLRMYGCKFNGGAYGYQMAWNGTASGDLVITSCSIEGATTAGFYFDRASGTGTFSNVVISDNQFVNKNNIKLNNTAGATFMTNLTITGNSILTDGSGSGFGVTLNQVDKFQVTGNLINANGGNDTGILIGSTATTGRVEANSLVNFGASGTKVSNSSTTAFVVGQEITTQTADYIVKGNDRDIICNKAGTLTLTLGSAIAGKELWIRTITANTVVSASSNVVPAAGGAAGTAILAATAGKWARLIGDGTNWQIMASN